MCSSCENLFRPALPEGWASYVQPEGATYFATTTGLRVVTDAPMYRQDVCARVLHFAAVVSKIVQAKGYNLPETAEVYLGPDETGKTCIYYFADHAAHSLFWLDPIESYELDIQCHFSMENLGNVPSSRRNDHLRLTDCYRA